jgi:fatty-acyl-CoA synthase
MTHFDWFDKWNIYDPDKVAFREYETQRELTYHQVNNLANATAAYFFNELGLKTGDRVAVLAENNLEYMVLLSVAQKSGIMLVPLNFRLTSRELDFMLTDSDPVLVMWEEKFAEKMKNAPHFNNVKHKLEMQRLTDLHKEFSQTVHDKFVLEQPFNEDHPLFLIYTSGTTAFPKGAIYTHKMFFWNSINTMIRLDITASDRTVNCTPPFHTGSWNVLTSSFILHGAYTLIMRTFEPDVVMEQMEKDQHTLFWGVPTMLKMMEATDKFKSVDLEHMRYFVIGGEAMPIPLINLWAEKGVMVRQGYGLTEVGPNVTSLHHRDAIRKQGSIGTPNFFMM